MWSIDCIFINLFDYEYSINELLILCLKHLILKFALSFLIYNVYVIWFEIIWNYIRGNLIYCILSAKIDQLINILNKDQTPFAYHNYKPILTNKIHHNIVYLAQSSLKCNLLYCLPASNQILANIPVAPSW